MSEETSKDPYPDAIHEPMYDLVETLEIGKNLPAMCPNGRRGIVLRLRMKTIPNRALALDTGVYLCQLIAFFVHPHNTIYKPRETGEQAQCWIEEDHPYGPGPIVYINDKYWGDREVDMARDFALLLARRYDWKVVDNRESLLVQIAKAAAEGD
jgi:hypothetical protein